MCISFTHYFFCRNGPYRDDMPVNSEGMGAYDILRDAGRLQIFPRTEGLSTTDFIGRLMALTGDSAAAAAAAAGHSEGEGNEKTAITTLATQGIQLLQSTNRIVEFAQPYKPQSKTDRVVYIDGTFDIFNIGHATTLMKAKELGSYLIVGLYGDQVAKQLKGSLPVSTLFERMLCVLSCKYVDSVLMDVPVTVTEDMLSSLHVDVVACGSHTRTNYTTFRGGTFVTDAPGTTNIFTDPEGAYKVPRDRGIFVEVPSKFPTLNVETFIRRIAANREAYVKRNTERVGKEKNYYKEKNDA
jgi:ethanolamine-phosphate cytidylyltransferase